MKAAGDCGRDSVFSGTEDHERSTRSSATVTLPQFVDSGLLQRYVACLVRRMAGEDTAHKRIVATVTKLSILTVDMTQNRKRKNSENHAVPKKIIRNEATALPMPTRQGFSSN